MSGRNCTPAGSGLKARITTSRLGTAIFDIFKWRGQGNHLLKTRLFGISGIFLKSLLNFLYRFIQKSLLEQGP